MDYFVCIDPLLIAYFFMGLTQKYLMKASLLHYLLIVFYNLRNYWFDGSHLLGKNYLIITRYLFGRKLSKIRKKLEPRDARNILMRNFLFK